MGKETMNNNTRICHITTVHPRRDIRVFYKECKSLHDAGYHVSLIVNDGLGDEVSDGIEVIDLNGYRSRLPRMFLTLPKAFMRALGKKADIYHFHDPELLLVGFVLALCGKRVVYDVHEDVPNNLLMRGWVSPGFMRVVSRVVKKVEYFTSKRMSACVCTTPHITNRFIRYKVRSVLVRNYPSDREPEIGIRKTGPDSFRICYAGGISENRGIREMVAAAERSQTQLVLMGNFRNKPLLNELQELPAWNWVDFKGILSKQEVEAEYLNSNLGLAVLHPDTNYLNSLPIKIFEYMMFGLPVICSDFELWREIVDDKQCGICIDPCDVDELVAAILKLKNNALLAKKMSENGKVAVAVEYNWRSEFKKLEGLYKELLLS